MTPTAVPPIIRLETVSSGETSSGPGQVAPSAVASTKAPASASASPKAQKPAETQKPTVATQIKADNRTITAEARTMVEDWRGAWESGNLDRYMAFYAPNAVQGSRTNAEAIRRHKQKLWVKSAPKKVDFQQLEVVVNGNSAVVTLRQEYSDARGGGDKGIKSLKLERLDNAWRIAGETWSAVP
jgi:ketosteroid isomerase-like protein